MPTRFRTGFTLPEILGVFVLILVIAAILFPFYQHDQEGKRHMRRSACTSNMEQFGLALLQYSQDNNDTLPPGINATGNGWAGEIYPFVQSTAVYRCPNDTSDGPSISYAENQYLVKRPRNTLFSPNHTVALYEFTTLKCDPSTPEAVSATGLSAPQESTRHSADFSLNFLFADGHCKYLTPDKVSGGPTAVSAKAMPQGTYEETFAIK
jgi:prepilin-type processing-associated H-X9-DG protein